MMAAMLGLASAGTVGQPAAPVAQVAPQLQARRRRFSLFPDLMQYGRTINTGRTVAQDKRAAKKRRNVARHRRAARG